MSEAAVIFTDPPTIASTILAQEVRRFLWRLKVWESMLDTKIVDS